MDIAYCYEKCDIGKIACEKFLDLNNSAFDAAYEFRRFAENCFKTCPYHDMHAEPNKSGE